MKHWYFWVLAPVLILSAIIIPLGAAPRSLGAQVGVWALSATLLLAALGLADARRFQWALRTVAAAVLVAGIFYFASELAAWLAGKPLGAPGRRGGTSLWQAALFLLVFGLPALRYALFGRSGSVVDVIAVDDHDAREADAATTPIDPK